MKLTMPKAGLNPRDTDVDPAPVWLLPERFLRGVRHIAGVPVVHIPGLPGPYLGQAVHRSA